MIINDLSDKELQSLMLPFTQLRPKEEIDRELRRILQYEFTSYSDLYRQTKIRFVYKGFEFTVNINDAKIYLIFTAPRNWWPLLLQARRLVKDFQELCKAQLPGIDFKTVTLRVPKEPFNNDSCFVLTHYIDARNMTPNEIRAADSPTLILVFERDEAGENLCQVELLFDGHYYQRVGDKTLPVANTH